MNGWTGRRVDRQTGGRVDMVAGGGGDRWRCRTVSEKRDGKL